MSDGKILEIVYLYEVENANPNGDPLMDNRPRYDDELEVALVSDVRIKRWIRDYIIKKYKLEDEKKVYVRDEKDEKNKLLTREKIIKKDLGDRINSDDIIKNYIDIRLFGATLSIKGMGERSLTGPVQFRMGRSLNKVEILQFQGTTTLPSGEGKGQGTTTEWWGVRYGVFSVYGVVNYNNTSTGLKEEDVKIMMEALGNLFSVDSAITRSKLGHKLIGIITVKGDKYIGNLDDYLRLEKEGKDITYNKDEDGMGKTLTAKDKVSIDLNGLIEIAEKNNSKVKVWINPSTNVNLKFEENRVKKVNTVEELV